MRHERSEHPVMSSGYCIRRGIPGDEVPITDLFNRAFGHDDPDFRPRSPDWWHWKFPNNPAGSHTLVAEDGGGRLVAHYGGVPLFRSEEHTSAIQSRFGIS